MIVIIILILIIQNCNKTDIINYELNTFILPNRHSYTCSNMSINYLREDVFHSNPKDRKASILVVLDLSYNNISILHDDQFSYLLELQYISMTKNYLKLISSSLFSKNINIKYIKLDFNDIVSFEFRLDVLKSLYRLDLVGNKLSTLTEMVFRNYFVKHTNYSRFLAISNNIFKCNCTMYWIRELHNITLQIQMNNIELCTANMSMNLPVYGCFMRQLMDVKCEQFKIDQCNKGIPSYIMYTLFHCIYIPPLLHIYI